MEVGHVFFLFCYVQNRHRNLKDFALIKKSHLHVMGERGLPKCKGIESCLLEDNLKNEHTNKQKPLKPKKNPKKNKNHTTTPKQNKKQNSRKTLHG